MKPINEQEWHEEVHDGMTYIVDSDDRMVCTTREVDAIAIGKALAALPDMARELLHLLRLMEPLEREGGLEIPGLATLSGARAALRKAGVMK